MNSNDGKNNLLNKSLDNIIHIYPSGGRELSSKNEIKIKNLEDEKLEEKESKTTYPQKWESYNLAQTKEKILLMNILDELLNYIPFPEIKKVGRNPVPIREKIFYLVMQSYNEKSSRRCISDLELARRSDFIQKTPHFNTVLKCIKEPVLIDYLKHLISVSGIPLQRIETDFSVDSSGFSTSNFGRWFDVRLGSNSDKRKFVKAHVTCGTRTNIISSVNITKGNFADSPEFEGLVMKTKQIYDIREVSADKAYSSKHNLEVVQSIGAIPFIPFKSNAHPKGNNIWKRMYLFYTEHQEQFYEHYHKRSNSESTFHMIKRKFGDHLRSKTDVGQTNELLAKCLCHNLCVLIQESFEIGIDLDFKLCAKIEIAHK